MLQDSRINFRQIEVFRAIMLTGSITQASVMLRVSQPAVSQLLRNIEGQLQFKLFERAGGRLRPTMEAHTLFAESQHLQVAIERVERAAHGLRRRHERAISLLISPSLALSLLPPTLVSYRSRWPAVHLSCEPLGYRTLVAKLQAEEADIGVAMGPEDEEGLDSVKVGRVPLVCAIPENHHLKNATVVTPKDLTGETLISFRGESAVGREIASSYEEAGVKMEPAIHVPFGSTALELVKVGLGAAVVDALTAQSMRTGILLKPFAPVRHLDIAVLHNTRLQPSKPISDLIATLKTEARQRIGWRFRITG